MPTSRTISDLVSPPPSPSLLNWVPSRSPIVHWTKAWQAFGGARSCFLQQLFLGGRNECMTHPCRDASCKAHPAVGMCQSASTHIANTYGCLHICIVQYDTVCFDKALSIVKGSVQDISYTFQSQRAMTTMTPCSRKCRSI